MNKRHELLDRIEALEHRSRAFERHSREELQILQQQLEAVLGRRAGTQAEARELRFTDEPAASRPQAPKGVGQVGSRGSKSAKGQHSGQRLPRRVAPGLDRNNVAAAGVTAPARIPGVRIAYIGGRPESIERIRDYWEGRGAVFMHYGSKAERLQMPLDPLLARADLVFFTVGCISPETALRLKAFCERVETPLIPLHNAGMSGLRRALTSWCPLT